MTGWCTSASPWGPLGSCRTCARSPPHTKSTTRSTLTASRGGSSSPFRCGEEKRDREKERERRETERQRERGERKRKRGEKKRREKKKEERKRGERKRKRKRRAANEAYG
eukprot:1187602-Prorocentrum_minimum.AAC.5